MIVDDSIMSCSIDYSADYSHIYIQGRIKSPKTYNKMVLIAANPIDRMTNYSGSGLPFPCAEIAFDNTPNKLIINPSGEFNTTFKYPNSFYAQNGSDKIISSVFFLLYSSNNDVINKQIELIDWCVLRTLVNRNSRKGPEFYAAKDYILPIASAENVMRAYAKAKIENDIA